MTRSEIFSLVLGLTIAAHYYWFQIRKEAKRRERGSAEMPRPHLPLRGSR